MLPENFAPFRIDKHRSLRGRLKLYNMETHQRLCCVLALISNVRIAKLAARYLETNGDVALSIQ